MGFSRFLGVAFVIKAEAWAILEGVRLAADRGVESLEVESDLLVVVNALNRCGSYPNEISAIIDEVLRILGRLRRWTIRHIWREANLCANLLAGLGRDRCDDGRVMLLESPLLSLVSLMMRDMMGLGLSRDSGIG